MQSTQFTIPLIGAGLIAFLIVFFFYIRKIKDKLKNFILRHFEAQTIS